MEHDSFDSSTVQIPLTRGFTAFVSSEDADLAGLSWYANVNHRTVYAARLNYTPSKSTTIYLHRLIMERILERPLVKGEKADHVNRNGLDCTRKNLRLATHTQNKQNESLHRDSKSGYKGVSWHTNKRKWRATITVNKRPMSLGYYTEVRDAARAYNKAAREYFGEFAVLNEVPPEE
jgi:hypothetical protein